jgi:hypothetical protein
LLGVLVLVLVDPAQQPVEGARVVPGILGRQRQLLRRQPSGERDRPREEVVEAGLQGGPGVGAVARRAGRVERLEVGDRVVRDRRPAEDGLGRQQDLLAPVDEVGDQIADRPDADRRRRLEERGLEIGDGSPESLVGPVQRQPALVYRVDSSSSPAASQPRNPRCPPSPVRASAEVGDGDLDAVDARVLAHVRLPAGVQRVHVRPVPLPLGPAPLV